MTSIALSDSSKHVVENTTKIMCELMTLKTELISERNQDTEKQQKQLYLLNQTLKFYAKEKEKIFQKKFEFTPCVTTYKDTFFNDDNSTGGNVSCSSDSSHEKRRNMARLARLAKFEKDRLEKERLEREELEKEEENEATESEYELSDVDEEETKVVNIAFEKALIKLARNRQTKQYIHITTTY